jgi:hypothetical protein
MMMIHPVIYEVVECHCHLPHCQMDLLLLLLLLLLPSHFLFAAAAERENQMGCYCYFQMRVANVLAEVHSSVALEACHHRYLHRMDYCCRHHPAQMMTKEGDFLLPLQKLLSAGSPFAAVVAEMAAAAPSVQSQQADHSLLHHCYLQMDLVPPCYYYWQPLDGRRDHRQCRDYCHRYHHHHHRMDWQFYYSKM